MVVQLEIIQNRLGTDQCFCQAPMVAVACIESRVPAVHRQLFSFEFRLVIRWRARQKQEEDANRLPYVHCVQAPYFYTSFSAKNTSVNGVIFRGIQSHEIADMRTDLHT